VILQAREDGKYTSIGMAVVDGIMHGEAWIKGGKTCDLETFTLV